MCNRNFVLYIHVVKSYGKKKLNSLKKIYIKSIHNNPLTKLFRKWNSLEKGIKFIQEITIFIKMYQIANNDSSNQDYYKYTKIKEVVFALAATSA